MRNTLLDFSQRRELSLHAAVVADVNSVIAVLGVATIVVGAFARDLHLYYGSGIAVQRQTEDVDFAFAVESWAEFEALRKRLIESKAFRAVEGEPHRLRHRNSLPIDLVPFGNIETADRQIAWPPRGDVVMGVFGFREALASTEDILLPENVKTSIVSLASLALLKIVAWDERHRHSNGKDASDLMLIVRSYLKAERNMERFWNEFSEWTEEDSFDLEQSGARMLGYDIRQLLDERGVARIAAILEPQASERDVGELPQEMGPRSPEHAHRLLRALFAGIVERVNK